MVQHKVLEGLKQQREINKEEHDRYLAEQLDHQLDKLAQDGKAALRKLLGALFTLDQMAKKSPGITAHPRLGGFSMRLDDLAYSIHTSLWQQGLLRQIIKLLPNLSLADLQQLNSRINQMLASMERKQT
jgi:cell division protein ZapA (FtsZ GTPase activity inhibitor)